LMLGRQIGEPRRRKGSIDRNVAGMTRHAANSHGLTAIRANVGNGHQNGLLLFI
jgi:hypothetical protein